MSKAWKEAERRIASLFGHIRRPLSGNSRAHIGGSDTMTKEGTRADIFIEVKHRKAIPFLKHIQKTERQAKEEGTPWIFVVHQKGDHKSYAITDCEMAARLWLCWKEWKKEHPKPETVNVLEFDKEGKQ
jgi:hypothetical protein